MDTAKLIFLAILVTLIYTTPTLVISELEKNIILLYNILPKYKNKIPSAGRKANIERFTDLRKYTRKKENIY